MISFHLNTSDLKLHHVYCYFREGDDKGSCGFIARAILRCVTSPIVWEGGHRQASKFKYADWLVLDFDDGISLDEAFEAFKDYTHVMGTTKSHQRPKGSSGLVCDRFRVWFKLKSRCHNLEDYKYTIKKLALKYGADSQAIDGARKFLPCVEIVSLNEGLQLEIEKMIHIPRPIPPRSSELPHRFIPKFIADMLANGVEEGRRNYSCYVISKYLVKNGFTQDEVFDLIMSSPIPAATSTSGEVRSAVRNGSRA